MINRIFGNNVDNTKVYQVPHEQRRQEDGRTRSDHMEGQVQVVDHEVPDIFLREDLILPLIDFPPRRLVEQSAVQKLGPIIRIDNVRNLSIEKERKKSILLFMFGEVGIICPSTPLIYDFTDCGV